MRPHLWIVPLACVTIAGCSDDGSVVGPSSVVVRGQGRNAASFRNELEFVDPPKECRWQSRRIWWYPHPWTCPPAR
jgi:hypothetical protein